MIDGYTLETDRPMVMEKAEKYDGKIRWVPDYKTNMLFGRFAYGDKIRLDYPDNSSVDVVRVSHPENGYQIVGETYIIHPDDIPVGTVAREYISDLRKKVA
jgi:hypothetical protein